MSATAQRANGHAPRVARVPEPAEQPAGSQLAAAVLDVQASAPKLLRNKTAEVVSQKGRYTYGYVTLDAIVDAVLPLLVEHELLWTTFPTVDANGGPALRYRMTHIPSGESDEDVMSLLIAKPDPQGQGSGITYARRYALAAYLNLTVDPDDDGAAASAPPARSQSTSQPTAKPAGDTVRQVSAPQRKMLYAKAKAAKLTNVQFANALLIAQDKEPSASSDEAAAGRFLDRELDRFPARLVDDLIEQINRTGGRS